MKPILIYDIIFPFFLILDTHKKIKSHYAYIYEKIGQAFIVQIDRLTYILIINTEQKL